MTPQSGLHLGRCSPRPALHPRHGGRRVRRLPAEAAEARGHPAVRCPRDTAVPRRCRARPRQPAVLGRRRNRDPPRHPPPDRRSPGQGEPAADAEPLAGLRQRYDKAVASGITRNRHRDWHDRNHPGCTPGCWLCDYAGQVWLFTREPSAEWANNVSAVPHPQLPRGRRRRPRRQAPCYPSAPRPEQSPVTSEHADGPGHRNVRHRQVRCPPDTRRTRPPRRRHRHRSVEPLGHPARRVTGLDLARGRHRGLAGQPPARPPVRRRLQDQGKLYSQFDHIAPLSAPADTILARIGARTGNPYGWGTSPDPAVNIQAPGLGVAASNRGSRSSVGRGVAVVGERGFRDDCGL